MKIGKKRRVFTENADENLSQNISHKKSDRKTDSIQHPLHPEQL